MCQNYLQINLNEMKENERLKLDVILLRASFFIALF